MVVRKILLLGISILLCHISTAQTLKVISYNIHHGADKDEVNTLEEMGHFIRSSGADVVGLQEVDSMCRRSGRVDQMKRLAEITGMHYAFVRHFAYDGGAYGLGVLSRYPISDVTNHRIPSLGQQGSLALLSAKVTLPGKSELRFATVHYALDQPTRIAQSAETLRFLKSDIPVILTGDLNAEPDKKEISQLSDYFSDIEFVRKEGGKFTFPVHKPVKKIDYIFANSGWLKKVVNHHVLNNIGYSDHLPVSGIVKLRSKVR